VIVIAVLGGAVSLAWVGLSREREQRAQTQAVAPPSRTATAPSPQPAAPPVKPAGTTPPKVAAPAPKPVAPAGPPAKPFEVTTFGGKRLTLKSFAGHPLVLNFSASWCPPCKQEAPSLQKLYEAYSGRGLKMLTIMVSDTDGEAQGFAQRYRFTFPVALADEVGEAYGVEWLPTTFFINGRGEIVYDHIGPMTYDDMVGAVEKLL
jgi:thiol-disulfide isomerase/thioredoxin